MSSSLCPSPDARRPGGSQRPWRTHSRHGVTSHVGSVEAGSACELTRLLARLRAGERDAYRRRLREELSATWRHLPRLDLEILETCEPEMVLSTMA